MGWEILTITHRQAVPKEFRLLPLDALLAIAPQRDIVKLTYRLGVGLFNTGTAYFDADTGLLLYHNAVWTAVKMFFVLAEINYDFAGHAPFPEDDGPHTGYRSFVSEQGAGGSVIIHSMVESRRGATLQTLVMPSAYPSTLGSAYESECVFGDVPVLRRIAWLQSSDTPPEQWPAFGQHLYWWVSRAVTGQATAASTPNDLVSGPASPAPAINVFDVPMTRTSVQPLTYTAAQAPSRFHFTRLTFDGAGYLTEFSASDPSAGLALEPPFMQKTVTVDGRDYYREHMAQTAPTITSFFPAAGPTLGGTVISITGTAFVAGATSVTFGGAPASNVTVTSSTSLTCTLPAGSAGLRDVSVTTMGGVATVADAFKYLQGGTVAPPADPSQPVTVSVALPAGTMTATFSGVTAPGLLLADSVDAPESPTPRLAFLRDGTFFVSVQDAPYRSATFCFPYDPTALPAEADEHALVVMRQPPGSSAWVDVTSSHDAEGDRVCGRDATSLVAIAAPTASPLAHARYLAEGATGELFATSIALLNPSASTGSNALLRFLRGDATTRVHYVWVPPWGRRTVTASEVPEMATAEFSTVIESDMPLVADRTMTWSASTEPYGAHAETSVAAPALTWYLAEGATHSGFELFYLLQNPNPEAAQVLVRYLRPSGPPIEKTYALAPQSRSNIWVNLEEFPGLGRALASTDVSAVIESLDGRPIIVERAMYAPVRGQVLGAGHESGGITAPAEEWFLAEGATGPFFDLFVLIANPGASDAQVEARYLLPDGSTVVASHTVKANSRFNIWVDYEDAALADTAVSTTIRSVNHVPVIVERAMWWPGGGWVEAHNSPGATATGTTWALAEGEVDTTRNKETYILVANTSPITATVRVTLFFEDGTTAQRTYAQIPANSRFNVPVGNDFPESAGRRFGAIVESGGLHPALLVVERAMYWDAGGVTWAAGTNALATKLQ